MERDLHSPQDFSAVTVCKEVLSLKGLEFLELAAEGGKGVFLRWGQAIILTHSWLPYLWHPACSLRLGC